MDRATKMLILSAARTLFSEKGYEQTPVEEICALAGVAKGTFFYHFESKQYIVRYILAKRLDEIAEKLYEQMEPIYDPLSKAEFFVSSMIDQSEEESEAEAYFKDGQPDWFREVQAQERMHALYPLLEMIVAFGIEDGSFRIKNPDTVAPIAFLGIDQYLYQYALGDVSAKKGIREFTAKTLGVKETALAI